MKYRRSRKHARRGFEKRKILRNVEGWNSRCRAIIAHGADRGGTHGARQRRPGDGATRLGARARGDGTDPGPAPAHPPLRHHRARGNAGRRSRAPFDRRMPDLRGTRDPRQPFRALGADAEPRQGRDRLPDDAESARIPGDLARADQRRRRCFAHQHQSSRRLARPLHRSRCAGARHRRRGTERAVPFRRRRSSRASRKSGRTAATSSSASIARSKSFQASG